mmetsp:Transcript_16126/g.35728  ORF Transcript_16126/g.35728 Transcript_16126/m.35728 type:complete len:277 (-) Transcript_16126:166-996(-)
MSVTVPVPITPSVPIPIPIPFPISSPLALVTIIAVPIFVPAILILIPVSVSIPTTPVLVSLSIPRILSAPLLVTTATTAGDGLLCRFFALPLRRHSTRSSHSQRHSSRHIHTTTSTTTSFRSSREGRRRSKRRREHKGGRGGGIRKSLRRTAGNLFLLFLQEDCGDAEGLLLRVHKEGPQILHKGGRLLLQKARHIHLHLLRIHVAHQHVHNHVHEDVVLESYHLDDFLRDPLVDHLQVNLLKVHLRVQNRCEQAAFGHLRHQSLVALAPAPILLD